jgi:hypothetical protein
MIGQIQNTMTSSKYWVSPGEDIGNSRDGSTITEIMEPTTGSNTHSKQDPDHVNE